MQRGVEVVFLASLALAAVGSVALTQPAISIRHVVECPSCAVTLERHVTLGGAQDTIGIAGASVERTSSGRFIAVAEGRSHVLSYDQAGRLVEVIGRRGQGPGEFDRSISEVFVGRNDSVFVVENSGRVSVFSPTLRFVRQYRISSPDVTGTTILADGRTVFGARISSPQSVGLPYHVASSDAKVVASFGADSIVPARGETPPVAPFVISPDGKDLWSNRRNGPYAFDIWSLDGKERKHVSVTDVPWWTEPVAAALSDAERKAMRDSMLAGRPIPAPASRSRPGSGVSVAGFDSKGRVWVIGSSPSTQRSYLEVLDLSRQRVIASQVIERSFRLFAGGEYAYSSVTDTDGIATFTIWKVTVKGL